MGSVNLEDLDEDERNEAAASWLVVSEAIETHLAPWMPDGDDALCDLYERGIIRIAEILVALQQAATLLYPVELGD